MWSCSLGLFKDCRFFKFFFQQIIHKSSDFVSLNLSCFQSFKRTLNDLFKITCMLILSEYSSFMQKSFYLVIFVCTEWFSHFKVQGLLRRCLLWISCLTLTLTIFHDELLFLLNLFWYKNKYVLHIQHGSFVIHGPFAHHNLIIIITD